MAGYTDNSQKHNYHITPNGEIAVCRAIKRKCPWSPATAEQMAEKPSPSGLIENPDKLKERSEEEYLRNAKIYGGPLTYRKIEKPDVDLISSFIETQEGAGGIEKTRSFEMVLEKIEKAGWNHELRLEHGFFVNHLGQFENFTNIRGYKWHNSAVRPTEKDMPKLIDHIMENGGQYHYDETNKPNNMQYEVSQDAQLYVTETTYKPRVSSASQGFNASMEEAQKLIHEFYTEANYDGDIDQKAEAKANQVTGVFKSIETNSAPEKAWLNDKQSPDYNNLNPFYETKSHDDDTLNMNVVHGRQYMTDRAFNDFLYRRNLDLDAPNFNLTLDNRNGVDMSQAGATEPIAEGASGVGWKLNFSNNSWNLETTGADGYTKKYDLGADGLGLQEALTEFSSDPYQLGGRDEGPPADQIPDEFRKRMGANNFKMHSGNAVNFIIRMNRNMAAYEETRQSLIKKREAARLKKQHNTFMHSNIKPQAGAAGSKEDEKNQKKKKTGFFNTLNNMFS